MLQWKWQWPKVIIIIKPLNERHVVTLGIFLTGWGLLMMARENPGLWEVELFKILLQAVFISGIIGLILAFHFAANKGDEKKTENTTLAFEAIKAAAESTPGKTDESSANAAAEQMVQAAEDEAAHIRRSDR